MPGSTGIGREAWFEDRVTRRRQWIWLALPAASLPVLHPALLWDVLFSTVLPSTVLFSPVLFSTVLLLLAVLHPTLLWDVLLSTVLFFLAGLLQCGWSGKLLFGICFHCMGFWVVY